MVKDNDNLGDLDQSRIFQGSKLDKDQCSNFYEGPNSSICIIQLHKQRNGQTNAQTNSHKINTSLAEITSSTNLKLVTAFTVKYKF